MNFSFFQLLFQQMDVPWPWPVLCMLLLSWPLLLSWLPAGGCWHGDVQRRRQVFPRLEA